MPLFNLVANTRPVLVVRKGDSATLLVNRDITNQIYYGNDTSIVDFNTNSYSVLDPLGSITVDGTTDLYAIAASGSPVLDVMSGAASWAPSPAQTAAQISALGLAKDTSVQTVGTNVTAVNSTLGTPAQQSGLTALTVGGTPGGIPVLRGTSNTGSSSAQTLAAATTATLISTASITKPSYEAIFQLNLPAGAGTIPFAVLAVNWTDSNTGLTVGYKQFMLTAGNGPSNALTFYLSGPCRGNQITLTLQNLDPAQTMTYTYAFNQTSHIYVADKFLQPFYAGTAPITFQNPGGNPSKGAIAMVQTSINASGNITRLTAACNLKCKLLFDNSTANACNIYLQDPGSLYNGGTTGQNIVRVNLAAQTTTIQEFQFPNGPLQIEIANAGASGAVTPGMAITAVEY